MCDQETALSALRTINTTLDVEITTSGRDTGNNITFYSEDNPTAPTYDDYKMRRKAEVLKYSNNKSNNLTKNGIYSQIAKGNGKYRLSSSGNKNFILTQNNKNNYTRNGNTLLFTNGSSTTCNTKKIPKPGTNSNIPSSFNEYFYLDNTVPYFSNI